MKALASTFTQRILPDALLLIQLLVPFVFVVGGRRRQRCAMLYAGLAVGRMLGRSLFAGRE